MKDQAKQCQLPIICTICQDYIVFATKTFCEHTFCQACIEEYLLCVDECPTCFKPLRKERLSSNVVLSNIVADYVSKYKPQHLTPYNQRRSAQRLLKNARTVTNLAAGSAVDVRDEDYVWRTGKIIREVLKDRRSKHYIVKYDRASKREEMSQGSPRLAALNSYTSRKDIPHYNKNKLCILDAEGHLCIIKKDQP